MSASKPSRCVIQFAKLPVAGEVKTRLIPALGAETAKDVHQTLLQQTLSCLAKLPDCAVQLWVSREPEHVWFQQLTKDRGLGLYAQQGDDLGQRMGNALSHALQQFDQVVIVGSDCPVLSPAYIDQAFAVLAAGSDAVVGPAEDGGYVLLGLRRFSPVLMQEVDWGTERVLQQTRERLAQLGWCYQELATLWDVDRHADWLRYQRLGD